MGEDKAVLRIQDAYLIEYPIRVLQKLTDDVRIIGDPVKYAFLKLPVIPDYVESKGPLTGVYTALKTSPTHFNLVLACDMPLVRTEFLKLLIQKAPQVDAVMMKFDDGHLEPLCSIYSAACLKAIEESFERQDYKISDLLGQVRVSYVSEDEISLLGLSRHIFANINTREEFRRLSKLWSIEITE
jgi:molybdopterin-guanine dinucleotide biosynthesis protein A